MSYDYSAERPWLFTEEGQRAFIKARDAILEVTKATGAIREAEATHFMRGVGDSWKMLAVTDRMVELGDLELVDKRGPRQSWIYKSTRDA